VIAHDRRTGTHVKQSCRADSGRLNFILFEKKKARKFKNTRRESQRLPRCPSPSLKCRISCVRPQAILCQFRQLLLGLVSAQAVELAASDFQTVITSSDSASIIGADYTGNDWLALRSREPVEVGEGDILGRVVSYKTSFSVLGFGYSLVQLLFSVLFFSFVFFFYSGLGTASLVVMGTPSLGGHGVAYRRNFFYFFIFFLFFNFLFSLCRPALFLTYHFVSFFPFSLTKWSLQASVMVLQIMHEI
jgi:hypothetical protein